MLTSLPVIVWLALSGCADPRDTLLPTSAAAIAADPAFQEKLKSLDDAERTSLAKYFIRTTFSGGIPEGTTLRAALADQAAVEEQAARQEAEAQALAAKLEAERAALQGTFDQTVTVALISKRYVPADWQARTYQDTIHLDLGLQNKSAKDIAGVKGTLVCEDMFGSLVKRIGIAYDDGLPAGAARRWSGTMNYNQFMDDDKKLAATDFDKLKTHFEFDAIVFTDGSRLEMPTPSGP